MTDTPAALVPAPVYGLRTWTVVRSPDGDERLGGPYQDAAWPVAGEWLHARCRRTPAHAAPAPDCRCGIHAWHPSPAAAHRVLGVRRQIPGVVEARGAVEVHEEGFRAERARPHALVCAPGRNARLIARLARAHGIPVVEAASAAALETYCREHQLGLEPAVVAELIGPETLAAGRRARRRARTQLRLRVAAAVALTAVLLATGLLISGDPPSGRTLTGRTGEIETP